MPLKQYIDSHPGLKKLIHWALIPTNKARPRRWVSWFVNPFVHRRHRTSSVSSSVRLDVLPFNGFELGANSAIEAFSVVNNGVGAVRIGANSLVGIGAIVIGPVEIGANVIMAQHVVLSGLNHTYENIHQPIWKQPVTTKPIVVEDECWIGANVTITAGITIGRHSVVAGGSVVTHDVPPYSVVGGNPARVLKQYDESVGEWLKAAPKSAELISRQLEPVMA